MERLTIDEILQAVQNNVVAGRLGGKQMALRIVNELCEYKRIEQDTGINLITLFKAINEGVYAYAWNGKILHSSTIMLCGKALHITFELSGKPLGYLISDYGKNWALTREELEK